MALTFNDEQEAELLKLLGLPEVAPGDTDAGLTLDTITDLAHQVEAMDPAKPSTVAAAAKRNGMEVIDTATADALRRDAAEGRRVAASAAAAKVEAAVDSAIDTGRIMPSRKKHWVTLCSNDDEMLTHLASIAPGTAVPLDAIGHAADTGTTRDVADAAAWFY
ncbi:hypothetical protein D8S82_30320 [Mycobacterium hodleri]|uniref:Mu-like prophage I protein n=1 Tax=Mycolicibacterium hodleri TaxID=49897 RepID=A0A544VS36_9MYCO|nr:phage protease [Mycolicibacterium hodleri]TQR82818.1 hypothetical protein D8S82_30320 [Mycolicibacterium hodleri]